MIKRAEWYRIVQAVAAVLLTVAVVYVLEQWLLPLAGVALLLLLAVVVVAFLTNFIGALIATIVSIVVFNFLFTEPRYSLHMTDADEIVTALVFLAVAVIISHLTTSFRAQRESLRQSQLRSNILLSVSHDLRTPLASIMGNLSTLQSYGGKLSADDRNELLQAALDESDRLHRYIENLLQATRIQYGAADVNFFDYDVRALLAKVVQRFAQQQRIRLTLSDEELMVAMQSSLLEQAFYNIIDNALKFSRPQGMVEISTAMVGDAVQIDVLDDGPGVSPAHRRQIFDVFYSSRQGDSGAGGTGLGLPVSKGIVELHGGSIRLLDTDSGCHIRVRLPLVEEVNN
ncbi:sensor histidine kinase [Idiomarina sp. OT37-5b]|uniref:sensor histidine kinase n=1 Tax=Idiomarina sp. OT37-5b TaxID=2100422 RepID=UPI000CF94CD1|nr:DUF4118 domain-containing protein [Idiomarina sp. OT37-5b]AVJ55727.1 sensor histidine kinase [Idiomarina sp. OT37-5b]